MPQITPNEQYKAMLSQHVKSGAEVDLTFMNNKTDYFNQLNGMSIMHYSAGSMESKNPGISLLHFEPR